MKSTIKQAIKELSRRNLKSTEKIEIVNKFSQQIGVGSNQSTFADTLRSKSKYALMALL